MGEREGVERPEQVFDPGDLVAIGFLLSQVPKSGPGAPSFEFCR